MANNKRILNGSNRSRAAKEIKALQRAEKAGITIPQIAQAMQPAVMEPNTTNGLREACGRIDQMLDIAAGKTVITDAVDSLLKPSPGGAPATGELKPA
ncbi:hypothetical protein [Serratia sp. JSRIV006]|uniref:hypothetical protein n=1 Tax=Serratia sp. JSRIV006 TaxID=2831896 RepID=UPI001CBD9107|nr:hypothetical protein [Serratia sp. JSRIV006]UAN62511.1 hypothetical protein KGP16_23640 [Serratia sp. JSRIV006]